MESESGGGANLEERLKSLLCHLQTESGILDRVVYKNKNQHRRCPYFQALLKVRRDVRLLLSAGLGEILNVLFPIIDGKKPAQRAFQSKRQKKNNPNPKHTYQERVLGVARLLSQMAEPILQAAIQISFLLAKSFFTGFSLTILTLLARLRVLVQQMLLDVVLVFNKVSSLSQQRQMVKLTQGFIEAFREYYPSGEEVLTLECVWEKDKFVLLERANNSNIKKRNEDQGAPPSETSIKYETIQFFTEAESEHEQNSERTSDFALAKAMTPSEDQSATISDCTNAQYCQIFSIEEPTFDRKLFVTRGSALSPKFQGPSPKMSET